jgi:hypothetical protein
MKKN